MAEDALGGLDPEEVRATLLQAAGVAAERTLAGFRTRLAVENKWAAGFDPVTAADRDAETAIRALLGERFPDHGVIGEEWEAKEAAGDFSWIIDPIDGTRAFISGVPVWGTLVGLMHRGRAVAGLVAQPFTGELWLGMPGETVYQRGGASTAVRTSSVTELREAKISATSPDIFELAGTVDAINRLRRATLQCRWGLDCYAYALLASGYIDIVAESALKDVDISPLIPVIENAGGVVTTWEGGRAEAGGNCIAAATPELHDAAMRVLNG